MCVRLMGRVFDMKFESISDKLVLLALADSANSEDHRTWIAVKSKRVGKRDLLLKTSMSLRAVQGAIKRLCDDGHLIRVEVPGKGCTYFVLPDEYATALANDLKDRVASAAALSAGDKSK